MSDDFNTTLHCLFKSSFQYNRQMHHHNTKRQGYKNARRKIIRANKYLYWPLIFVGPQYGTRFMSISWRAEFLGGL
jgi:hypothetical protein